MVKLLPITKANWHRAINLPTSDEHEEFVAPNVYSIAEAQFHCGIEPYGIYFNDEMVGFAMFGVSEEPDENDRRFWIWRLMIAENHRRKGYGEMALRQIIAIAHSQNREEVVLSTEPENGNAIRFYQKFGFRATGIIEDDEEIFIYSLKGKQNEF